MFLLEFQSLDQELVDVLRLFVAEVGTEVFHEFDDAVFAEVFVCGVLEGVVCGHSGSCIIIINGNEVYRSWLGCGLALDFLRKAN